MENITARQCSNCLYIYLPSHFAACPQCAGRVPRKLRDKRNPMNAGGHRFFIETYAKNPDVVGFRTGRSKACDKDRCCHTPQLVTVRAALGSCALPCRPYLDCYGYIEVVFRNELTDAEWELIQPDI